MDVERIVVIGASAGGVRTLEDVVAGLPAEFPAPVLIVLHLSANHRSLLPGILNAAGPLPAAAATDREPLQARRIYVAIPDHHLLVNEEGIRVTKGPKENHFRPSVDVLFRSAAYHFGARAIGVVLSGSLSDGSSGLYAIKRLGGVAIIQHPDEALYGSMPRSAMNRVDVDYTMPAKEIGLLLSGLLQQPAPAEPLNAAAYRRDLKVDIDVASMEGSFEKDIMQYGEPSTYTCPACNGVLFRIKEGTVDRFRCHTGHGFSTGSLVDQYGESIEHALWEGVKALQETCALLREAARRSAEAGDQAGADELNTQILALNERLHTLRAMAFEQGSLDRDGVSQPPSRKSAS